MSDTAREIVRRRPRCAFHYKVDETIRLEDREVYLAMLRDPRTTIDMAHAWLQGRGYTLSRSAVARHRRRTLTGDAEHRASTETALAFAQIAGEPNAPDFAAGAAVQIQYLVFQRLLAIGEIMQDAGVDAAATGVADDDHRLNDIERAARVSNAFREIPSSELLALSRLIDQCVQLSRGLKRDPILSTATPPPVPPETEDQRFARERATAEEILFGKKLPRGSCGGG